MQLKKKRLNFTIWLFTEKLSDPQNTELPLESELRPREIRDMTETIRVTPDRAESQPHLWTPILLLLPLCHAVSYSCLRNKNK